VLLLCTGYKKYITEEDLWALPPADQAEAVAARLEKQWLLQQQKKKWVSVVGRALDFAGNVLTRSLL
jgi:hypothetical protein